MTAQPDARNGIGRPTTGASTGGALHRLAQQATPAAGPVLGPSVTPTLHRLARQATQEAVAAQERCDFCGEGLPDEHRHLLEIATRDMRCVCRACSILFDRREASRGKYQLLPQRRLLLGDFRLDAAQWERLRIPVGMVFFFYNTSAGRVMAYYPSPLGPTESLLELDAWQELVVANPALQTLQPDVEALLINRARGAAQHFLVPLDECYRLVGVIRTQWRGLSGGQEVWREVERFFDELVKRSKPFTLSPATTAGGMGGFPPDESIL